MLSHGLQALGIQPEAIALVGCDDFETADLLLPGNYRGATADGGDRPCYHRGALSQLLENGNTELARRIVLPVELVIRRSCGLENLEGGSCS